MSAINFARILIYRIHETGLEIFLINNDMDNDPDVWKLPEGLHSKIQTKVDSLGRDTIDLDEVTSKDGSKIKTLAIEGDWHDIPSMKSILHHDVKFMKATIKKMVPDVMEKGAFVAIKEAFKKVLPHQYDMLKELKEIIVDRNLTKYM